MNGFIKKSPGVPEVEDDSISETTAGQDYVARVGRAAGNDQRQEAA